jgi:hypothetical protein
MGFHAAAKPVAFLALLLISLISLYHFWKKDGRKSLVTGLALCGLLVVVGLGPRLLYSPPEVLLQIPKLTVLSNTPPTTAAPVDNPKLQPNKLTVILGNYSQSIMVYIDRNTTSHYYDRRPILGLILGVFFVLGLVLAFMQGRPWLKVVGIYALVLPFTNTVL